MSNIKYLHYRNFDGEVCTKSNKQIPSPRLGATVAYMTGPTGTNFAIAYCGPHDNYNKALGRAKSSGRLLSERYAQATDDTDPKKFIAYMDAVMAEERESWSCPNGYSRGAPE